MLPVQLSLFPQWVAIREIRVSTGQTNKAMFQQTQQLLGNRAAEITASVFCRRFLFGLA
jgi:aminoglycoside/choline kinase family phosphotransferase